MILAVEQLTPDSQIDQYRSELGHPSQQSNAFDQIRDWFWRRRSGMGYTPKSYLLSGYAGTGKTYTIQRVIRAIQAEWDDADIWDNFKYCMAAPTHKAVGVLAQMGHDAGLTGADFSTLASLLNMKPKIDHKTGKQKFEPSTNQLDLPWGNKRRYKTSISDYDLVIIDEASMIPKQLYDLILAEPCTVIFLGDRAQLPPIGEAESPVFTEADDDYTSELTEIKRYQGAIARNATLIRSNLNKTIVSRFNTELEADRTGIYALDYKSWEQSLIKAFQKEKDSDQRDLVKAIAWTNARVNQINKQVRDAIYGIGAAEYIPGETLMAKQPLTIPIMNEKGLDSQIILPTCSEASILQSNPSCINIVEQMGKFGIANALEYPAIQLVRGYDLTLELPIETGDRTIFVPDAESIKIVASQLLTWRKQIIELKEGKGKAWKAWYAVQHMLSTYLDKSNALPVLKQCYAITAHQSQGSTYRNVFIDKANILKNPQKREARQCLYVALTRASRNLIVAES